MLDTPGSDPLSTQSIMTNDNPVIGPGAAVEDDVWRALSVQRFPEIDGAVLRTPSHGASGTSTQLGAAHTNRADGSELVQGFPEIDGAVLGTPSHGASAMSTWLGAAHTQARQSCSQHSSGRLSGVWGCVCGGGGERMAVVQSTLH